MAIPQDPAPAPWMVVDVETSGTNPDTCRVISVAALAVTDTGTITDSVVTMLDPGVEPGPTHIHGITREMLHGQPHFSDIAPRIANLARGRTFVAHNAGFDYSFLAAEARRAGLRLPIDTAMCTVELANRLDLGLSSHKLSALAKHWHIPQNRPHDAFDDALVLTRVLTKQLVTARHKHIVLPIQAPDTLPPPIFTLQPAA